jgi:hypothetical protein
MKHSNEYEAFTNAVEHLMSIPKAEILRREAEYKKQADLNPAKAEGQSLRIPRG